MAEQLAQIEQHLLGLRRIGAHELDDRVECVEEEMWMQLSRESREPRLHQLVFQLDLTALARMAALCRPPTVDGREHQRVQKPVHRRAPRRHP